MAIDKELIYRSIKQREQQAIDAEKEKERLFLEKEKQYREKQQKRDEEDAYVKNLDAIAKEYFLDDEAYSFMKRLTEELMRCDLSFEERKDVQIRVAKMISQRGIPQEPLRHLINRVLEGSG